MKEKMIQYKWIIILVSVVILNFGWILYSNTSLDQTVRIEESEEVEETSPSPSPEETLTASVDAVINSDLQEVSLDEVQPVTSVAANTEVKSVQKAPEEVPIYICGAVENPGVYYVLEDAIINDVVACSGGFTKDADVTAVNLASPVQPNEKIIIPKQGEQIDKSEDSYENRERVETLPSSQLASQSLSVTSNEIQGGLININTATKEQLMTLNGIGEVKAEAIIVYRQENGGFKSIDEMMQISGIGEKTFEKIKQFITT